MKEEERRKFPLEDKEMKGALESEEWVMWIEKKEREEGKEEGRVKKEVEVEVEEMLTRRYSNSLQEDRNA